MTRAHTARRQQVRWLDRLNNTLRRGINVGELVRDVAADDPAYLRRLLDFEQLADDERTAIEIALANQRSKQ